MNVQRAKKSWNVVFGKKGGKFLKISKTNEIEKQAKKDEQKDG